MSPPQTNPSAALGQSIPHQNPHALSVSLPTWKDNVGWASGDMAIVSAMSTGYPRFFVHRTIQQLADVCLRTPGISGKCGMLFPSARTARECFSYLLRHIIHSDHPEAALDVIRVALEPHEGRFELHMVVFSPQVWKMAKSFWQHAGLGISSRYATMCLSLLPTEVVSPVQTPNVFPSQAAEEKLSLRKLIATLAAHGDRPLGCDAYSQNDETDLRQFPTDSDVFLYPSGMSAIWHAHQLTLSYQPGVKSVCFGFSYTDTLKVLEKWGPGCYFYGYHPDENLASLENFLDSEALRRSVDASCPFPDSPSVSAVFCECPSNPLLHSSNLLRLRQLADHHGFLIIIDDTVGTFINVNVLQYVDIVTTSLSKLFSGNADVMGGSLVLNPNSHHYAALKRQLQSSYVDDYFPADAIRMEFNSRDFSSRVHVINANARAVCHFLRAHSLSFVKSGCSPALADTSRLVIKDVFYPEWITRENYDLTRRQGSDDNFGSLFSLTFVSLAASEAFYNALPCAKGPSLGTNFTLSCPYTILAHFNERPWAAQYGVEEGIVRLSVGMEDREVLMEWFQQALDAAEQTETSRS